jgi:predicted metal-dependent peptidase
MRHVFFAALLLSTKMEEDESISTAATDMIRILYNPKFIEGLSNDLVIFVIVHEACHIMLKHGLRLQGRNRKRANIAMDFAINIMLKKAGFVIWEFAYLDVYRGKYVDFDGMSFEQIYPILEEMDKEIGDAGGGRGGGGPDGKQGGMSDDVIKPENIAPEAVVEIERQIQQKVAQAAALARGQGTLPGDIERLVDGVLNPPLPWQQVLQEYATQVTHNNESWARRDRRHQAIYLPSRYDEAMGELVLIGDTSGSMQGVFAQVAVEIGAIAEFVRPERIRIIWADDTDCAFEQVFEPGDEIAIKPRGGGGTDMRKPLKYAEQFDPIVVVLVTDCHSPWPVKPTPYPLIVCSTTNAKSPDWARRVEINR